MDMVRMVKEQGHIVGSCSDRPVGTQKMMWQSHDIHVDFTVLKHRLDDVKARFDAEVYYHIGDTDMDRFFAGKAGFEFILVDDAGACGLWLPGTSG